MLQYRQRVRIHPDEIVGYIDAKILGADQFLVTFRRSEFSEEQWLNLAGHGGPTFSRIVPIDNISEEAGPAKIINPSRPKSASWTDVVNSAEKTMKKKPSTLYNGAGDSIKLTETVTVGSVWKTRKGGYEYRVIRVVGDDATLSWTGGKDIRQASLAHVYQRYDLVRPSSQADLNRQEQAAEGRVLSKAEQRAAELVVVGSFWSTRRSGDVYKVISLSGNTARLSWTSGKYTRDVPLESVLRHYNPYVGEPIEEGA